MGAVQGIRRGRCAAVLLASLVGTAAAQKSVAITEPEAPLLPASFGEWKITELMVPRVPDFSLANANKAALEEDGPQRSQVADYARGGRTLHIEAIEFGDRTGAFSAFTLIERPGMKVGKELGASDAVGNGVVLFTAGATVVLVNFDLLQKGDASGADVVSLKPLAEGLPKITGNKGVAPLLPSLAPEKGLVAGSVRYALGPASYQAEGGVLPAHSLGWEKSAEAVTAQYSDRRGSETLTLLLYPTPMIAGSFTKSIRDGLAGMGPGFATARVRREGELVALATGSFSGDDAQRLVDGAHMRQEVSFDKDVQPVFHTEVQKTASLLMSIAILSGVLMGAAVLLGLFLGVGRAWIRTLRGKPAAVEVEFLSLHLAPQNKPPRFSEDEPAG
jgi:hypothetical protein